MLNETQLQEILTELSAKIKVAKSNEIRKADWGKLYEASCIHAEEIEVHACGHFPQKLIGSNFPNETNEERDYRKNSFQPTTKPYWEKAENKLNRIWAEQNYSIDWKEDKIKKYFTEEIPLHKSVLSYFESTLTSYKIADPNAVLVVDFDLPVRQKEDGELVIDDSEALKPYPSIYDSCDVVMYEEEDFALLKAEELSVVEYGGKQMKVGLVFYLYDNTNIYRIKQIGKKVDWKFISEVYYQHDLTYLPVWKLRGKPQDVINDVILYESYFAPALPHLNEAVIIHSTNRCVRNKVSYPIRVYYDQPCTNDKCNHGKVWRGEGPDAKEVSCDTCKGSGSIKFSWGRDYVHELPSATKDVGVGDVAFPGISFVAPDGAIIKDNEEVIDKYLETAFNFIHAGTRKSKTGTSQDVTGIEVKVDREDEFVSFLKISNELFDLLKAWVDAAYKIRENKDSAIAISPPKNFDLTSAEELAIELESARTSGLPPVVISEIFVQYVQKKFPLNNNIARIVEVAQYCDSLFTLDSSTIQILQTAGNIEKWQVILHINFDVFMNALLKADEKLFEKTNDEIAVLVKKVAEEKATALDAGKNNADKIMKDLAGGTGGGA